MKRPGPLSYAMHQEGPLWYVRALQPDGRLREVYVRSRQDAVRELRTMGIDLNAPRSAS